MSSLLAQDFLSEVTNGALSDHSKGVHKLTDTQKAEVKGGYNVEIYEVRNMRLPGASIAEVGAMAILHPLERNQKKVCSIGDATCSSNSYVNKQHYNELALYANPERDEYLLFTATKTVGSGAFAVPRFTYGTITFNARTGTISRNNATSTYVASELRRLYKNQLDRILVTQY